MTSTVSTKVKGLGYVDLNNRKSNSNQFRSKNNFQVFDTPDYVIPPNEYNAIFIMTNYIETVQSQGYCDAVSQYI